MRRKSVRSAMPRRSIASWAESQIPADSASFSRGVSVMRCHVTVSVLTRVYEGGEVRGKTARGDTGTAGAPKAGMRGNPERGDGGVDGGVRTLDLQGHNLAP